MDEFMVDRVLLCVDLIPPGRLVSYGNIARIVGLGPRHVGAVMSRYGSEVTWWRVTNHTGRLPTDLLPDALPRWRDEGIELLADASGARIGRHRADLDHLAAAFAAATRC